MEDQVGTPPGLSNHTPGFSEVSRVFPRPKSCLGQQEGVRPVSPGSGGQSWKTAPPLASGHLNESSAPRGTGSPRSIFRRGSRNPDRVPRQRREEKTDKTQRERKRGSLKRWRQAQDSTFRLTSMGAQQKEEERGEGPGRPFLPAPCFQGSFSADMHCFVQISEFFYSLVDSCCCCCQGPRHPSKTPWIHAGQAGPRTLRRGCG